MGLVVQWTGLTGFTGLRRYRYIPLLPEEGWRQARRGGGRHYTRGHPSSLILHPCGWLRQPSGGSVLSSRRLSARRLFAPASRLSTGRLRPNSARPSPVPSPQAAFTMTPKAMAIGTNPAATGWPLSGATRNQATSVGSTAPSTSDAATSGTPSNRLSSAANSTPHTPPQNVSDQSWGTPKGCVGCMEYGARSVSSSAFISATAPW